MTYHSEGSDRRDERTTRALRARYAAPADPGYWDALEARIMERVASESGEWWLVFGGWVRAGLVAAGIAVVVAGTALWQTRTAEARVAYAAVFETPTSASEVAGAPRRARTEREATIQYLISH